MKTTLVAVATILIVAMTLSARSAEQGTYDRLTFLLGDWVGTGSGEPGKGSGGFSFALDLQGRVMVRRAHSTYPAGDGKPAINHDDLLIVHSGGGLAVYFDNEGHVIHYGVTTDANGKSATFLSVDPPPSPLFRLTYGEHGGDELSVRFEISNSGRIEDLKTYLDGVVRRQAR